MKVKAIKYIFLAVLLVFALGGCSAEQQVMDGDDMFRPIEYVQISQDEAKEMMEADDGHLIVDVRREDEYAGGHIPGAVCIPNESIGDQQPAELPDKEQIILVYCRSGNRSEQAAQKLADMGYTNVYEFGGILDWTGETVAGTSDAAGTESSTEASEVAGAESSTEASEVAGAETSAEAAEIEPSSDSAETTEIEASSGEEVQNEQDLYDATIPTADLVMEVNGKIFYPALEENSSADAFFEKLKEGYLEVELHDYGNFEKVGPLPWELPTNDEQITTVPGDIILYQGNQITVYYDENTWDFTRLAKIDNVSKEELLEVLGEGDVTVKFWLEWSE